MGLSPQRYNPAPVSYALVISLHTLDWHRDSSSIMIDRMRILSRCLYIMAVLAQSLPVTPVPEKLLISTMRYDVVNHRSLRVSSVPQTLSAERMAVKELLRSPLPSTVVASTVCRACLLRVQGLVLCTVLLPMRYEFRTTGMRTWVVWPLRHTRHPPCTKKALWCCPQGSRSYPFSSV